MSIPAHLEINSLFPKSTRTPAEEALKATLRRIHSSADKLRSNQIVIAKDRAEEFDSLLKNCNLYLSLLDKEIGRSRDAEKKEFKRVKQRTETFARDIGRAKAEFESADKESRNSSKNYNEAVRKALKILRENNVTLVRVEETLKSFQMKSADGRSGYRLEFDDNYGAHLNVFCNGKKSTQHFTFPGNEQTVKALFRQLRSLRSS